jgi:hypothetical protein
LKHREEAMATSCHHLLRYNTTEEDNNALRSNLLLKHKEDKTGKKTTKKN